MIGGADRVLGPLVGAIIVVLLPELLSWLAQYRLLFVGLLLLVVLRLAPGGLVGMVARLSRVGVKDRYPKASRDVTAMLSAAGDRASLMVKGVSVAFGGVKAVANLTVAAEPSRITSIIGPNGAGKSTFFKMLTCEMKPTSGRIFFHGHDITGM
jgi:ABC-type multidrug transport system fused ATPase/permease subunit